MGGKPSGARSPSNGRGSSVLKIRAVPPESDKGGSFSVLRVRFEIPEGSPYHRVTRAFPDLIGEVWAVHQLPDGRERVEVDILGPPLPDAIEALAREPGVEFVSAVAGAGPVRRFHLTGRSPAFRSLEQVLEVLIRYPQTVQKGLFTIEVAGPVAQVEGVVGRLRRAYARVDVLCLGRDRMRTTPSTLTPQQDTLLHHALAAGYFEVPRSITLTELARQLGRSKSALSESLARIEKTILESAHAAHEF